MDVKLLITKKSNLLIIQQITCTLLIFFIGL